MLDAAETAISIVEGFDRDELLADRILVDAVIKNLTVIGEAASRVPDEVTRCWPEIPWRQMGDMRNFIVHEYFGISGEVLWGTVCDDLPGIVPLLRHVLERDAAGSV